MKRNELEEVHLELMFELITWINNNLNTPLTVCDISRRAGYSKWYLHKLFKRISGDNVWQYVIHRRLLKASYALVTTNDPILYIAIEWQFNDQQSFTRAFKIKFNITPKQFRVKYGMQKKH